MINKNKSILIILSFMILIVFAACSNRDVIVIENNPIKNNTGANDSNDISKQQNNNDSNINNTNKDNVDTTTPKPVDGENKEDDSNIIIQKPSDADEKDDNTNNNQENQIEQNTDIKDTISKEDKLLKEQQNSILYDGLVFEDFNKYIDIKNVNLYPANIYYKESNIDFSFKELWGYVNDLGKFAIKPQYNKTYEFNIYGLAKVINDSSLTGLIDFEGNYIVEPKYSSIDKFRNNVAIVQVTNEKNYYGFININGDTILEPIFENIEWDEEGNGYIIKGVDKYFFISNAGITTEVTLDDRYKVNTSYNTEVAYIGEGLYSYYDDKTKLFGIKNQSGEVICRPLFIEIEGFINGSCIVNCKDINEQKDNFSTNNYALIDNTGKYIIKPEGYIINRINNEFVSVYKIKDDENFGIYAEQKARYGLKAIFSSEGNQMTDFLYYDIFSVEGENDILQVVDEYYSYFINLNGQLINTLPKVEGCYKIGFIGGVLKLESIDTFYSSDIKYLSMEGKRIWETGRSYYLLESNQLKRNLEWMDRTTVVEFPLIKGTNADEEINDFIYNEFNLEIERNKKNENLNNEYYINKDAHEDNQYTSFLFRIQGQVLDICKITDNYSFGTMHGSINQEFYHFGLESGKIYTLKDLFIENTDYLNELSKLTINELIEMEKSSDFEFDYLGLEITKDRNYYIDKDQNLVICFGAYEIAPYAYGLPEVKIPLNKLSSYLDSESEFFKETGLLYDANVFEGSIAWDESNMNPKKLFGISASGKKESQLIFESKQPYFDAFIEYRNSLPSKTFNSDLESTESLDNTSVITDKNIITDVDVFYTALFQDVWSLDEGEYEYELYLDKELIKEEAYDFINKSRAYFSSKDNGIFPLNYIEANTEIILDSQNEYVLSTDLYFVTTGVMKPVGFSNMSVYTVVNKKSQKISEIYLNPIIESERGEYLNGTYDSEALNYSIQILYGPYFDKYYSEWNEGVLKINNFDEIIEVNNFGIIAKNETGYSFLCFPEYDYFSDGEMENVILKTMFKNLDEIMSNGYTILTIYKKDRGIKYYDMYKDDFFLSLNSNYKIDTTSYDLSKYTFAYDELAVVSSLDGKEGIINKYGDTVLECKYERIDRVYLNGDIYYCIKDKYNYSLYKIDYIDEDIIVYEMVKEVQSE